MRTKVMVMAAGVVLLFLAGGCGPDEVDCDCGGCQAPGGCVDYASLSERQEEVKTNLRALFMSQTSYFGEYGTYAHTFADMGWSPWPPQTFYYAYYIDGDSVQPIISVPYNLPPWLTPATSERGFTAVAIGNIDCDATPDIWTINDLMIMSNYTDDIAQ